LEEEEEEEEEEIFLTQIRNNHGNSTQIVQSQVAWGVPRPPPPYPPGYGPVITVFVQHPSYKITVTQITVMPRK